MKMNNFRKWLSAVNATPLQRRLAALTHLDRARLLAASAEPWYIWEAAEPASAS